MTFQYPTKSLTNRDYAFIALVIFAFLLICTVLIYANLSIKNGGGDFYVQWVGSRSFLFDRIDPYSSEVSARVQHMVYANSAQSGDKPYILDTPFQLLPFYYPFSFLADPALARAIFTLILELALFALAVLSLRLTDWEPSRIYIILFILFTVFNFYTIQSIYTASPILIFGFLYVSILLTLRAKMDVLSGALIAFSLAYWEVGALFLILVVLRAYYEKRSQVFAGFFMTCFILFFIAFLTSPGWIFSFLNAVAANLRADFGFNIRAIFIHLLPAQGRVFAWILISILVIILGYEWSSAYSGDFRRFYWASCLSLTTAPLLGFRTEMPHLAVLVIPLALIFAVTYDRWRRIGEALTLLLMFIFFIIPWGIYFLFDKQTAQNIIFLFLPLSTFIGLYWIRWWAIRPPRVLFDFANTP